MSKQKGGSWLAALEIGTAVFAAKKANTFTGFLWKFVTYILILTVAILVIGLVLKALGLISIETFVPVSPSAEGDKKAVTPAGNVILY